MGVSSALNSFGLYENSGHLFVPENIIKALLFKSGVTVQLTVASRDGTL